MLQWQHSQSPLMTFANSCFPFKRFFGDQDILDLKTSFDDERKLHDPLSSFDPRGSLPKSVSISLPQFLENARRIDTPRKSQERREQKTGRDEVPGNKQEHPSAFFARRVDTESNSHAKTLARSPKVQKNMSKRLVKGSMKKTIVQWSPNIPIGL